MDGMGRGYRDRSITIMTQLYSALLSATFAIWLSRDVDVRFCLRRCSGNGGGGNL